MKRKRGTRRPRNQREAHRPDNYLGHIDEIITAGTLVVLWCRVSTEQQRYHLVGQEVDLRAAAENRGGTVVAVVQCVSNATRALPKLCEAARLAEEHQAVILAESTSRYARPRRYHPGLRPRLTAGIVELSDVRWVSMGVKLATLVPPQAADREQQTRRGIEH